MLGRVDTEKSPVGSAKTGKTGENGRKRVSRGKRRIRGTGTFGGLDTVKSPAESAKTVKTPKTGENV